MIVVLVALLSGLPAALSAQVVRGVVRDSASGAPAAGVLVTLIDAALAERRTVLTDESGQFTIAAAGAGSFTLETKRIGVRPVLTPRFALAAGETRQFNMALAAVAARLAASGSPVVALRVGPRDGELAAACGSARSGAPIRPGRDAGR